MNQKHRQFHLAADKSKRLNSSADFKLVKLEFPLEFNKRNIHVDRYIWPLLFSASVIPTSRLNASSQSLFSAMV